MTGPGRIGAPLPQGAMIERVRQLCQHDERLVAAMMYGSFARAEGDAFSDIEFVLFFADDELERIDQRGWVAQIAPVELYFVNEFGNGTAIFDNLVRGEFHFDRASDMHKVAGWRDTDSFPTLESTLILDRTGELTRHLRALVGPPPDRTSPDQIRSVCDGFINWTLFGTNVLARGEVARALHILGYVQRNLLWLIRLSEGETDHWPTPSKGLEGDITASSYARYARCTADLDEDAIRGAYATAWSWGEELMLGLGTRHGVALPAGLLARIDQHCV